MLKITASARCRVLPLLAVIALSLAAAPARADMEQTSMAQTPAIMAFLAAYIAEDEGIWRDNGLDVKVVNLQGAATVQAVIAGSVDFALSGSDALTRAAAHGQKMLALAALNNQSGQMTVLRKDLAEAAHFDPKAPLAERAKVLAGKTIAVGGVGSVSDVFLKVIAHEAGIPPNGITIATSSPFDLLAAFSRKAYDGISFALPYPLQLVDDGSAVLVVDGTSNEPKDLMPLAAGLLMTRPQVCADHRSICEKMGHSTVQSIDFLLHRKDDSIAILAKRFPQANDAVLHGAYDAVVRMTQSPPSVTAAALANGDKLNDEAGLLKPEDQVKSYEGLFTNEFLK
jgi:NitT/TauT family transport system substrate-binding protein